MALQVKRISPPIKGWNTVTPLRELGFEYANRLENVWFDQANAMNKRAGQVTMNGNTPAPFPITHVFEHFSITGRTQTYYALDDGTIRTLTLGTNTDTWNIVASGFIGRVRTTKLGALTAVSDGLSPMQFVNDQGAWATPSVFDTIIPPVLGNISHTHNNRAYFAGNPSNRMLVYYSSVNANDSKGLDYWDSITVSAAGEQAGFLDVSAALSQGDTVTGLSSYKGYLVVFLRNSIVFYAGNDPIVGGFTVFKTIEGLGCVSQDTIQPIGNDTIFLSQYGFKTLQQIMVQGDAAAKDSSVPINSYVIAELNSQRADIARLSSVYVEKWGVYLCTFGNATLAYHTQFQAWTKWIEFQPLLFIDSSGSVFSMSSTHVHRADTILTFDILNGGTIEAPIVLIWELPPFRGDTQDRKSRWNRVEIVFEARQDDTIWLETWVDMKEQNSTLSEITLNPVNTVAALGNMLWGWVTSTSPQFTWGNGVTGNSWIGGLTNGLPYYSGDVRVPVLGRGELFSVRLKHDTTNRLKLTAFEYYYNQGGIR